MCWGQVTTEAVQVLEMSWPMTGTRVALLARMDNTVIDFSTVRFLDRLMDALAESGEPVPPKGSRERRRLRAKLVRLARKRWVFRRRKV